MSKLNIPNHTQIPNTFLDDAMSELSGSEFKVLLATCRKTLGWHKRTDSISLSQLKELTGLSRKTITVVIPKLENAGLISVDRTGNINRYDINYGSEKNTPVGEGSEITSPEVVKGLHQGSEKITPPASEITSHTKETVTKETFTKNREKEKLSSLSFDLFDSENERMEILTLLIYEDIAKSDLAVRDLDKATLGEWMQPLQKISDEYDIDPYKMAETWRWAFKIEGFWKDKLTSTVRFSKHFETIFNQHKQAQSENTGLNKSPGQYTRQQTRGDRQAQQLRTFEEDKSVNLEVPGNPHDHKIRWQ